MEISNAFVGDGPYCNGYQTRCVPLYHRALGVVFSTLCHDIAPFADPTAPARLAASEIGFDAACGRSPYLKVCDSWPVGEATAEVGELVRSDVPVLAIIGALGPYVRPDQAREGLGEFSNLSIVVAPADGHNVVAKTDCMLNTRNAWVDNPAMDPAGKACSAGLGLRGICANRSGQASAATRATSGGRLSPSAPPMLLPRSPPNPSRSALKSTIPPRTMTRQI